MAGINTHVFMERYEHMKTMDLTKNNLIEDMLLRLQELEDMYKRESLDHDREKRINRDIQLHELQLMDQISKMKQVMNREPFIMVLLDGDGMIFQDHFLQNGEQGGKDAANQLWAALTQYIARNFPNISSPKIVARIYANVRGLGFACYQAGIADSPSAIEDFVRGFNESRLLFDFVDVGNGKDRADGKISELFKLNLYNCHCLQVFLGCSHDNGYARLLEETLADIELLGRISLIEGVPFEKELDSIKASYRITQFKDLFRSSKIVAKDPASTFRNKTVPLPPQNSVSLTRTSTNTTVNTSNTTASSVSASASQTSVSWASLAASNPGNLSSNNEEAASAVNSGTVNRNKYGQRIDPENIKSVPRDEVNRLKRMKLCNYHHLMGGCPNIPKCSHDHTTKLTKSEASILKAIARTTPCHNGSACDKPECIYGHICPWSEPGSKDCPWGNSCRFESSQHGVDTKAVKLTKV